MSERKLTTVQVTKATLQKLRRLARQNESTTHFTTERVIEAGLRALASNNGGKG